MVMLVLDGCNGAPRGAGLRMVDSGRRKGLLVLGAARPCRLDANLRTPVGLFFKIRGSNSTKSNFDFPFGRASNARAAEGWVWPSPLWVTIEKSEFVP